MNKNEALKIYNEITDKIRAYTLVLSTTSFDRLTVAPKKGSEYRNRMMSIVEGELYSLQTDPKYVEAILTLSKLKIGKEADRDIALARKAIEDILKFTKEETMEFSLAQMTSYDARYEAKNKEDYKIFEPHLLKLIELSKKRFAKRDPKKDPYNIALDDFEEGMDKKKYDHFFYLIK
ncbi:MAG: hypothetical protein II459_08145 [Erysipelotrichaceae bacterium]|nr:hypothetical protein [Erysipelotrichaceae bacterium]